MTADEFRAALAALSLSQTGAARLFWQNDRTVRRWASGEQDIPRPVVIALQLMIKHQERPDNWTVARPVPDTET